MSADLRCAWTLVAVAVAGVLVALSLLGGLLWRDPLVQEVAHVHGAAPPPVPGPARDTLARSEAQAEDETSEVTVEVVDFAGEGIEGVELWFMEGDASPRQVGSTDADGRLRADAAGPMLALELHRGGVRELISRNHPLTGDPVQLHFRLARLCPGPVRVVVDGATDDMKLVDWSGDTRIAVQDGDEVHLPRRRCRTEHLALARPLQALTDVAFSVDDDALVEVHFPASSPPTPRPQHRFSLTLDCTDCPELVTGCEGQGTDWQCTCKGACTPTGKWPESLFDWRYLHRPLIHVEPGDDDVFVALPDTTADIVGHWTGPVPCAVVARDEARGVEVEGLCLSDGSFFVADLFVGAWTVTVAWDDAMYGEADPALTATRTVELAGEVDLGEVGPG